MLLFKGEVIKVSKVFPDEETIETFACHKEDCKYHGPRSEYDGMEYKVWMYNSGSEVASGSVSGGDPFYNNDHELNFDATAEWCL